MTTQTFDPHTATLEQCCDYIAECMRWRKIPANPDDLRVWEHPSKPGRLCYHPVERSLDSIEDSLPNGWRWSFMHWCQTDESWTAEAVCKAPKGTVTDGGVIVQWYSVVTNAYDDDGGWREVIKDEKLARARCSALAWMKVKEDKK